MRSPIIQFPNHMARRSSLLVIVALALLCACSGPSETAGQSGPSAGTTSEEAERSSAIVQYETFDASEYEARLPTEAVEVNHQVPPRLMRGRADEGVKRTVQGFRIQVFSAVDKQAAQDIQAEVRQWWESQREEAPESTFDEQPPIIIMYSQPYYRVRIGAFAERDAAEQGLQFVQEKYPNAFIARSAVTVTR